VPKTFDSEIEKLLRANGIAGATSDNSFVLCKDGVEGYEKLIGLLEGAQKSIYLYLYIWQR